MPPGSFLLLSKLVWSEIAHFQKSWACVIWSTLRLVGFASRGCDLTTLQRGRQPIICLHLTLSSSESSSPAPAVFMSFFITSKKSPLWLDRPSVQQFQPQHPAASFPSSIFCPSSGCDHIILARRIWFFKTRVTLLLVSQCVLVAVKARSTC